MGVKALVTGVSLYSIKKDIDLPFCKNDVVEVEKALNLGLKVEKECIYTLGKTGIVSRNDFSRGLSMVMDELKEEDTLIFYFSGHGTKYENTHCLVFSDGFIATNEIIEYFEQIKCKNKVIFLDACLSGDFSIDKHVKFDIEDTISEFVSKGYAVLSSSNSQQFSYPHPNGKISLFTSFLCEALYNKCIVREGRKSLYDIQRLVKLYLEVWNTSNSYIKQEPIFRSKIGGTIYFNVENYTPYCIKKVYEETEKYIIYNVEPIHSGLVKRYAVRVILKEPFSIEEISKISLEIKEKIKHVEVYSNSIMENRLKGLDANIVVMYFGLDEEDMILHRHMFIVTWVDENQDKDYWYRVNNKNTFIKNGVRFEVVSYYELLKNLEKENVGEKKEFIFKTKEIASRLITDVEKFISLYNEYRNGEYNEIKFVELTNELRERMSNYYLKSTNLEFPPTEFYEWSNAYSGLFGTIYDFTLFYNNNGMTQREERNRKNCTESTIKRYYEELEKIKKLESNLDL
ncbi:caspase family protein [uncultured Clostridium sp.]|uniref:caspase family protein n=1 Tax=uncultured Clostridium sp. TaxID=59620 RepID=UPI0025F383D5|nr:caspase family protein [uncultured Clostridium sp.]